MNTPAFTVHGRWRPASSSSSADTDLEAQTITSTHAPFTLPVAPAPARTVPAPTRMPYHIMSTADAIDDFFGATRASLPPPPYADAELPAYSAEPHTHTHTHTEPVTLARSLFKFGFVFPPFWVLGAIILVCPLTAPAEFEPSKSGAARAAMVRGIRAAEVRWARRCVGALGGVVVLAGAVGVVVLYA